MGQPNGYVVTPLDDLFVRGSVNSRIEKCGQEHASREQHTKESRNCDCRDPLRIYAVEITMNGCCAVRQLNYSRLVDALSSLEYAFLDQVIS